MKDARLPKIILFGQPSRAKYKANYTQIGWEKVGRKNLGEIETSWEDVKRKALNRLG